MRQPLSTTTNNRIRLKRPNNGDEIQNKLAVIHTNLKNISSSSRPSSSSSSSIGWLRPISPSYMLILSTITLAITIIISSSSITAISTSVSVSSSVTNGATSSSSSSSISTNNKSNLPDLVSETSDEPVLAITGQDVYISCVAKNLQNNTILWRYSNDGKSLDGVSSSSSGSSSDQGQDEASSTGGGDFSSTSVGPVLLTAAKQRITSDPRFSVIQGSHNTWLLKISQVRLADTGTYICETNSQPKVRVLRLLSVMKSPEFDATNEPNSSLNGARPSTNGQQSGSGGEWQGTELASRLHFGQIEYNFTECCKQEYVMPRCQRLCQFQQLATSYASINIVHECFSQLPSITRCMIGGRNHSDCCERRHIPSQCFPICGQHGDISQMSVKDQYSCAEYTAPIMACVAEGIDTLPAQPEMVIVEAVSSNKLRVSWQKVISESELKKLDGWIINLTKLSSFEDSIPAQLRPSTSPSSSTSSSTASTTNNDNNNYKVTSPTSASSAVQNNGQSPLANLTIVDVMNNSSLAAMTKLLAATSGTISLKLNKMTNEFDIENLKPYTVYQIQMFSYNKLGRSQLTDPIRAVTLSPESDAAATTTNNGAGEQEDIEPQLPDTRKCCQSRGVTLKRCLDTLCDPVEADKASIADLMICAPWSNITFSCLSSSVDHTQCCQRRGVSPFCLSMCSGQVKRVDYRHFRCLTHMSTYTNCILKSHDVLPGPPRNFTVGPITATWAVLNWSPATPANRFIQGYRIYWRKVTSPLGATGNGTSPMQAGAGSSQQQGGAHGDSGSLTPIANGDLNSRLPATTEDDGPDEYYYNTAEAATNPYLLDALQPDTVYETFAVTVNKYGQSETSVRFIFQTLTDPEVLMQRQQNNQLWAANNQTGVSGSTNLDSSGALIGGFNETDCCVKSGVHSQCQQLCDYDLKITDVSSLVTTCSSQMPRILRCMAANRNSVPCCRNKKVSDYCLNVCAGLSEYSPLIVATRCAPDFGKIIQCMDSSSTQIPGAPQDLHAVKTESDRVTIKWEPSPEDVSREDVEYQVRYQQLAAATTPDNSDSGNGETGGGGESAAASLSIPLHPLWHNLILTTNKTEAVVDKLKPNTKYSIYITAQNSYGISLPSLVLVVRTASVNERLDPDDKPRATIGAPHSLEILHQDTESIILKWMAPLFINADANIKYRVFYKIISNSSSSGQSDSPTPAEQQMSSPDGSVVQATNWTIVETNEQVIHLRHLNYSSQYAIAVQAFSQQHNGHMSEILLAMTSKPIAPTLNHPLVIGNPVEGGNVTIMCVALGQPLPQVSMFINGLLVQKKTQPYVIYHLVNLNRGHLTISCFAANGHGKDYASVQSRTEVSVKFGTKLVARNKQITMSAQSIARLTCEVSGNPQPTVIWTYSTVISNNRIIRSEASNSLLGETGSSSSLSIGSSTTSTTDRLITANERVSTLIASNYENPFTWTHTLIIKNLTTQDSGKYQCKARNPLASASEHMMLQVQASTIKSLDQSSDISDCCRAQNVSANCLPVCSIDGLDIDTALKTPDCYNELDKLMFCAADGSDHRNCCRSKHVPIACLRWCSGSRLSTPTLCFLSSAIDINSCFQEGKALLPGPPRNLRVVLASESNHLMNNNSENNQDINNSNGDNKQRAPNESSESVISNNEIGHGNNNNEPSTNNDSSSADNNNAESNLAEPLVIEWDPPTRNPSLVQFYRVFWRPFGTKDLNRTITNQTWIQLDTLDTNKMYEFIVKAGNHHGTSVYSDPLTVTPSEVIAAAQTARSNLASPWFLASSNGSSSIVGRVLLSVCFATMFMFGSMVLVVFLEKKGYLRRFGSSKSNSARVSFANPTYMKDSENGDIAVVPVVNGTSLEVLNSNGTSSNGNVLD